VSLELLEGTIPPRPPVRGFLPDAEASACRVASEPTLPLELDTALRTGAPSHPALDPAALWRQFAAALAGRPRVRISRDGGRTYGDRARRLTTQLPDRPAAVLLYDADGRAHALALDLDVGRGGRDQVRADTEQICQLLTRAGARMLVDESPAGGRHVWVPLDRPRPADELRRVLRALAILLPSLDPTPMLNVATGCLRPPGSPHKNGGHQQLITPWARAVDAIRVRTGPAAWSRLLALLAPQLTAAADITGSRRTSPIDPEAVARPGGPRPLPATYEHIARTGRFQTEHHPTPSEARLAVLASAAVHGWSLTNVQDALARGAWPGLAAFYARYPARHRPGALRADWAKALPYAARLVSNFDTGKHSTHRRVAGQLDTALTRTDPRLTDYVYVRVWRTAIDLATPDRWADRSGLSKRALLAAVAEAAHRRGTSYVDFGCRSLGLGATLDHATAAHALRALRSEPDPFLVLIESGRGDRGDLYELRIPDAYRERAEALPWRPGRLTGLHPVFHRLGVPAAHLLSAVEQVGPADVPALIRATHLSRATVYRTAALLLDHGLLARSGGRWRRTRLKLDTLARRLGIPALIDTLLERIRAERRAWWAFLGIVRSLGPIDPLATPAELLDLPPPAEPDPDPPWSPLELLYQVLGAVPVAAH
jgi:hypothetical protein